MFQTEVNKTTNLLKFVFSERVTPEETTRWRAKLDGLLGQMRPGFKLLSDFSGLESMDLACAPDFEFGMELCDKAGVSKVVRIITDPRKDIGFNIMALFHYRRRVPMVTCQTMEEALKALAD